jgi:ribA/ribD-fused uncharacterized protein
VAKAPEVTKASENRITEAAENSKKKPESTQESTKPNHPATVDFKQDEEMRIYNEWVSVVFYTVDGKFGAFSNMYHYGRQGVYTLEVNGIRIRTVEALYQACRFPNDWLLQNNIIAEKSPINAKKLARSNENKTRKDWEQVKVDIMRWCLRVKLAQNWETFSKLLLETGDCPIVEESWKDDFWGAKPTGDGLHLKGRNMLGHLLMELRDEVKTHGRSAFLKVVPPKIDGFLLLGKPVQTIVIDPSSR